MTPEELKDQQEKVSKGLTLKERIDSFHRYINIVSDTKRITIVKDRNSCHDLDIGGYTNLRFTDREIQLIFESVKKQILDILSEKLKQSTEEFKNL